MSNSIHDIIMGVNIFPCPNHRRYLLATGTSVKRDNTKGQQPHELGNNDQDAFRNATIIYCFMIAFLLKLSFSKNNSAASNETDRVEMVRSYIKGRNVIIHFEEREYVQSKSWIFFLSHLKKMEYRCRISLWMHGTYNAIWYHTLVAYTVIQLRWDG